MNWTSRLTRVRPPAPLAAAALLLLLPAGVGPAAAQEEPPSIDTPYDWVEGSIRVGGYVGRLAAGRGVMDLGPSSGQMIGARGRARVTGPISLEAGVGFGDSDRYVIDPRPASGPTRVDSLPLRWLLVEGGFQLSLTGNRTWHHLQPYALLGGGFVVGVDEPRSPALPDPVADADSADFRFQLGAAPVAMAGIGTEVILSDRIGLGFEARDHLWRLNTPDGFFREEILRTIRDRGLKAPEESQWTNNLEFSVTLWYYF